MYVNDDKIVVNWKDFIKDEKKNEFMQSICYLCRHFITDREILNDIEDFKVEYGQNVTIVVPVADVFDYIEKGY